VRHGEVQQLEARIKRTRHLASSKDLDDYDRVSLAQMVVVWSSSYLEATCREILGTYVEKCANPQVARAVKKRLDRFRNPHLDAVLNLVGEFDAGWREELRQFADGAVGESVNSIVGLRHRIAHGKSVQMSLARAEAHYEQARKLPRQIALLCDVDFPR